MRCLRCNFEGEPVDGGCARCGYRRIRTSGDSFYTGSQYSLSSSTRTLTVPILKSGDVLRRGRYRLIQQLVLPENQQGQGTAWLATDTQTPQGRVVIREVALVD